MNVRLPLLPSWMRWGFVLGVAGYIFYASILTVPSTTVVDSAKPVMLPLDKWRHFLAYATFGGVIAYAATDWQIKFRYQLIFSVAATIFYGVGIEFGQLFVPNRYASVGDAYANTIGALLILPWYFVRPHIKFVSISEFLPEISL